MKIETGKFYRTRDGRKVGPMGRIETIDYRECIHGPDDFGPRSVWWTDGRGNSNYETPTDLIAEWADGPVRTVTRTVTETAIEPGHYANLKVDLSPTKGYVCVGIGMDSRLWSADELRAAAAVLLELAGALEE